MEAIKTSRIAVLASCLGVFRLSASFRPSTRCYSRVLVSPELHGLTLEITTWGAPPFEDVGDWLTHRLEEPV
jgi:hypothetical protein